MLERALERVVARHEHRERVAARPPGPTRLLPQRCARAGPPAQQNGVQAGHVDAAEPTTSSRASLTTDTIRSISSAVDVRMGMITTTSPRG